MLLAGCSSKSKTAMTVWDHGTLYQNDVAIDVTKYDGYSAESVTDEYSINYVSCSGPTDCSHKIADVSKDIMTKYNGCYYFTAFADTMMEMYYCYDSKMEMWNEGIIGANGSNTYPAATMASMMEPVLKNISLNGSVTQIQINNCLTLSVTAGSFSATKEYVVIPGYLKVGTDDGSITFDQTTTVGTATLAYTSSAKYDYYRYNDTVIQAAKGVDISQYVTFMEV